MPLRPPLIGERMDDPDLPLEATERALRDLETVHRRVGNRALWNLIRRALAGGERRRRLLDVGTGNGVVASQVGRRAASRGVAVAIVGLDRKLAHLLLGRRDGHRQLRVVGDARALPFADRAVDVACSTLFQHHFTPVDGARVLSEMRRVSSRAVAVVDIRRSWIGGLLGRAVLALLRVGPVAGYDGRLSLDQSWTLSEVRAAAPPAAVRSLRRSWPFRWALELAPGRADETATGS